MGVHPTHSLLHPIPTSTKRRKRNIHVVPAGGRSAFVPKTARGRRLVECPRTQTEAIAVAVRAARRRRVEVVIHRPDGRIRDSDSYGRDSRRHRDLKH
ncbi:MAG: DUF2188 domain-containing protein [Gemmatimonadetes bacterium]|nr:DUF2188 domain-containing protein [Gemmatimonadota bacterium]